MTKHQRYQLIVSFLGVFLPVTIALFVWFSTVNTEMALLRQEINTLKSVVVELNSKLDKANLGAVLVRVHMNEKHISEMKSEIEKIKETKADKKG